MIECFKTEALADKEKVIGLQGQLLVQKDKQLKLLKASVEDTVQTTVESGMQSYSAAVQQNSASGTVCNSNILKNLKVIKSVAAEEDRSKNLIMFGLKEEEEEQLPALVTTVLEEIGEKHHFEATRVGWKRPGSTAIRPVKITVASSTGVHKILNSDENREAEASWDPQRCMNMSRQIQRTTSNKHGIWSLTWRRRGLNRPTSTTTSCTGRSVAVIRSHHELFMSLGQWSVYEVMSILRVLGFERQLYNLNTLLFDCFTIFISHNVITRWSWCYWDFGRP